MAGAGVGRSWDRLGIPELLTNQSWASLADIGTSQAQGLVAVLDFLQACSCLEVWLCLCVVLGCLGDRDIEGPMSWEGDTASRARGLCTLLFSELMELRPRDSKPRIAGLTQGTHSPDLTAPEQMLFLCLRQACLGLVSSQEFQAPYLWGRMEGIFGSGGSLKLRESKLCLLRRAGIRGAATGCWRCGVWRDDVFLQPVPSPPCDMARLWLLPARGSAEWVPRRRAEASSLGMQSSWLLG